MSTLGNRLEKLPPEVRRIIWKAVVTHVEKPNRYQMALHEWVSAHTISRAMNWLLQNQPAVADEFAMSFLAQRHPMLALQTDFGKEYMEVFLENQPVLFPSPCYSITQRYRDRLESLSDAYSGYNSASRGWQQWAKVLKIRRQLNLAKLGVSIPDFDATYADNGLLIEPYFEHIIQDMYYDTIDWDCGQLILEVEFTTPKISDTSITLRYIMKDVAASRAGASLVLDKAVKLYRARLAGDAAFGLADSDSADDSDDSDSIYRTVSRKQLAMSNEERRDKNWEDFYDRVRLHNETVLQIMLEEDEELKAEFEDRGA